MHLCPLTMTVRDCCGRDRMVYVVGFITTYAMSSRLQRQGYDRGRELLRPRVGTDCVHPRFPKKCESSNHLDPKCRVYNCRALPPISVEK
jgi:hypothetical protein